MKKTLAILMALGLVFAGTAFAKDTVQITLTSPSILKAGCEKAGAVTYAFDGGTMITGTTGANDGDWWYFDLPNNVTLCKPIDYFIAFGATAGATADYIDNIDAIAQTADLNGGLTGMPPLAAFDVANGPVVLSDAGGGVAMVAADVVGNIFFRVKGDTGTRRVYVYVYSDAAGSSITVPSGTVFKLSVLNGQDYPLNVVTDTENGNGAFGDDADETIDFANIRNVPYVENTLCIDATQYGSDNVFTSFDSRIDKFTFTGDSQIAHVNQNPISLGVCKGTSVNNIERAAGQTGTCAFDYETPSGYCPDKEQERILIKSSTPYGLPGDRYDIRLVSETQGVYFSAAPTVWGFQPSEDECTDAGTAVAAAWTYTNEAGTVNPGFPGSNCTVPNSNRVREIHTFGGAITTINPYDVLYVNLPTMVYDNTFNLTGSESRVTVYLDKYPCGQIFTATITLGTFVDDCPSTGTAAGTTNLLYPWFPPLDPTVIPGWWGGFTVVNAGTASGTVVLTFWEEDGDSGTLTTPPIAPGGQWNAGMFVNLLTQITPAAGNTGTLGDANFAVTAVCNFGGAGGFAFTGNGDEGTGYTAYVGSGGAWQ